MTTTVESTITFPYKRSLGPVLSRFFTGLTEGRILGMPAGDRVLCPPVEWDPSTGAELGSELVEVGPAGTVESWCWVPEPTDQHPLDHPFAFATIRLDGADTALIHVVDAEGPEALSAGMRVVPRWRVERRGHITDIEAFVPGSEALPVEGPGAAEPVTMMDYRGSVTYRTPVPANVTRAEAARQAGRFVGLRCRLCGRTYAGEKPYCPVDSVELTEADQVDLPQHGVVSNYTIITPVQYPGQTETDPFARVHVLLDGDAGVVLSFQGLVDVANEDVRIGMRVAAVWASEGEQGSGGGLMAKGLVGWIPTGEPDEDDPDLVNRIC